MQRIPHQEYSRADLDHATPEVADVIHRRLQSTIIVADDIRRTESHRDYDRRSRQQGVLGLLSSRVVGEGRKDRQKKNGYKRFHRVLFILSALVVPWARASAAVLEHQQPAIDLDGLADHVAGSRGSEKGNRRGALHRGAQPAQWDAFDKLPQHRLC